MIKLRPEDITRYQFLSQLKMSPSGRHGVFSVSRANLTTNGYDNQLWTLDAQTEAVQALDGTQGAKSFCFLNDETICFTAEGTVEDKARVRRGELLSVVYTIPVSGGEAKILCRIPLRNVSVEALAGNRLLLSSFYDNRRPDFESLPEDEKNAKLAQYALESEWEVCTESPFRRDSRGMVDGKRTRMFIYDLQTGALSPITEPWFDTLSFRVNREGTKVAIIGELFQGRMARMKGVYLYDVEKNTMQELLPDKGYQVSCVEFMNGSVMCSAIPWDGFGRFPNHDLYRLDPATGEARSVYQHTAEDNGFKGVSDARLRGGYTMYTDGDQFHYITSYDNNCGINVWREDGSVTRITPRSFVAEFMACGCGKLFACGFEEGRPQELYVVEDGSVRRITSFNTNFLSEYTYIRPELTSFINKDGVRIDGFVIYPANYEKGKKYPGVLEIHGGPRATYTDAYIHEMQMLSSNGYFVFFCNPRGSASRGETFSAPVPKEGTLDYEDIMEFTDHVLEICPDLDASRLGVTGGSFGGFMTNWIIGHTDRFRAAASCRSISNNISVYGVSDESSWGRRLCPWDNVEEVWDGSPLKYWRNVKTPTIFLQSHEDYRCPMEEATQMYTALQILGVDTKLCMFHGDSHELSRSGHPRNRVRRLREIMGWMDRYLKDAAE